MSWRFFSDTSEFQFNEWNFEGNTEQEYSHLIEIVNQLEKVAYIADYNDLGANACRILIPDYSEIYPLEDLIWDNHNKALIFRSDILNIHKLSDNELEGLLQKFDEIELDDYMLISELIGVCFEDTSTWGQLNIGELKAMIYLAVGNHEMAKEYVEQFLTFNDNLAERKKLYQALNLVLDIVLDPELSIKEYRENLSKMYSIPLIQTIEDILARKIRFYGLSETDLNLTGIDKHQRLIKSYKKLHQARLSSKNLT
jgi:ribosomal protein S12 methylthiotransferase accessory factor